MNCFPRDQPLSYRPCHLAFRKNLQNLLVSKNNASRMSQKKLSSINNVNFSYSLYVLPQAIIDSRSRVPSLTTQHILGAPFQKRHFCTKAGEKIRKIMKQVLKFHLL